MTGGCLVFFFLDFAIGEQDPGDADNTYRSQNDDPITPEICHVSAL